ncbi:MULTISPECIES: cytochrome P450 [Protofrankia]|uniref:Peroxidase n=1 Tax=Candidatus Protofrankia datiscae TaxID=2716812 RepID=F8B5A5_9ACTN|nr:MULTISPECIES: cytochrome P450 [Protofrankia]AEH10050.1 Peroxidase [Candidatus Protofrankia datiscae]
MSAPPDEVTDEVNILSPEAIRDPYRYFARVRDEHPVLWDPRYRSWLLTSHDVVSKGLRDARFSSDRIAPFIEYKLSGPDTDPLVRQAFTVLRNWMVFQDEPNHLRLRALVRRAFTQKSVVQMAERVRSLSNELLKNIDLSGGFDLIEKFAYPLPAMVIAEMLGVPVADRDRFKEWSDDIGTLVSAGLDDPDRYRRSAHAMDELIAFFRDLLRHYTKHPAANLITALIRARETDDSLSEAELIATCTLLLFGGHETTANLIANSILALIRHPDQMRVFREGRVPVRGAVEEFLRYDGPGKAVVRVLAEDAEFEGARMRQGQRVFMLLASANHDPAVFDSPDVLRLDRTAAKPHVAFGFGAHFCLGAALARLEASTALPIVVRALPGLRLADRELTWQPVFLTRGLRELWVEAGGSRP